MRKRIVAMTPQTLLTPFVILVTPTRLNVVDRCKMVVGLAKDIATMTLNVRMVLNAGLLGTA